MKLSFTKLAGAISEKKASTLHRVIQYTLLLFYIYVGISFFLYFLYITGESTFQVARPVAAEAFLPLSALMALKRFVYTGLYDFIHPAGLTILIMAIIISLLLRRAFCGYLCPIGAVSGLLHRLGLKLGIAVRPWKWLSILLSLPKYYLLWRIISMFGGMDVNDIDAFLRSPYNMVADSKMLLYMLNITPTMLVMLGTLMIGSMLIPGFWCRGFCPYGAFVGLFSVFSPVAIQRDKQACISCQRCSNACPTRISVHEKSRISGPECVGCAECTSVCPVDNCLEIRLGYTKNARKLPRWSLAVGTVILFFAIYLWAKLTGHWDSSIPESMLRMLHMRIQGIGH